MLMNILAWAGCFLTGLPGWETPLPAQESQVMQQAIVHHCSSIISRQPVGSATGRYSVYYVRPDQTQYAFQAAVKAWFTPACYHAQLTYSRHHENAVESIIIRNHNVIYSHRRFEDSRIPPFALATDVFHYNTMAVQHGLLVDPSRLALEMNLPKEIPLTRLHFYQQRNGLVRMHYRSAKEPHPVTTITWYDPAKGFMPVKQVSLRADQPGSIALVVNYSWKLIDQDWHCKQVKHIRYEPFEQDGETYAERHSEVEYDDITPNAFVDPTLFSMAALNLPVGSRIADFRKDAATPWIPYYPDGDPYEKKLDAMLADYAQLTPPLPRVAPWLWTWVMVGCLIALPLLLFPGVGLHLLRIVHVPQRLAVR